MKKAALPSLLSFVSTSRNLEEVSAKDEIICEEVQDLYFSSEVFSLTII